jgi:threonine aldolase
MIEMRSDTFTLPTEKMRSVMASAEVGDDVYGEDPTVTRLESIAAEMTGKPAACFMPSGTMANLTAILSHAPRGGKALVGNESDIFLYEAGGASVCGGVVYEPITTQEDGSLALDDLFQAFPPDRNDPQYALPALICIENTHNRMGGVVLPERYLAELKAFAHNQGVPVHMDGARIFNAAIASDSSVRDIAAYSDSVQFCLSKGLSAPVGSILAGEGAFIDRARRYRKMLGGGMRQAGVLAAAGIVALTEMGERLSEDHAHAKQFAQGISQIAGVEVCGEPQTNIVLFRVSSDAFDVHTLVADLAREGLGVSEFGHGRVRAVMHRGLEGTCIQKAAGLIAGVLDKR